MLTYKIEVTDTFGGEANYCWVRRSQFNRPECPAGAPYGKWYDGWKRQAIAEVRKLAGWPVSVRVDTDDCGDTLIIRPRGMAQIAFVDFVVADEE